MKSFLSVHGKDICGVLSGWDRLRFRGTIRWLASLKGLQSYMSVCGILLKDFGQWAESVTKKIRSICEAQAKALGIPLRYLRSPSVDKEAEARRIMAERNVSTGDICMFSVVEPCMAPDVRGNRATRKIELTMRPRKCVWIYHYWNDPEVGLGHTRLQTWLPMTVTVCLNGRHWLERQLIQEGIGYEKIDNCFVQIDDYEAAAALMEKQQQTCWPKLLDRLLARICPELWTVLGDTPMNYYWSAEQTEWATDLVFREAKQLDFLFPKLMRYEFFVTDSRSVMRFLGHTGKGPLPKEVRSDVRRRYEGWRSKHWVNGNSVKMYNKAGCVLRVETTIDQPRQFKVYRRPDDDPTRPASWQRMRKGVSDLHRRAEVSQASNERYLETLATAHVSDSLQESVADICRRIRKHGKSYRAINPWDPDDFQVLQFLGRGQHAVNGFVNRQLREALYGACEDPIKRRKQSARISRRLRLLRAHGLIRKVPHTNRYRLTAKGRRVATAILAASRADIQQLMNIAA